MEESCLPTGQSYLLFQPTISCCTFRIDVIGHFRIDVIRLFRIDVIRLTRNLNNFENILTATAEGLFVVSTFYYLLNNLAILKVVRMPEQNSEQFLKILWIKHLETIF